MTSQMGSKYSFCTNNSIVLDFLASIFIKPLISNFFMWSWAEEGLLKFNPCAISLTVGEYPFTAINFLIYSKTSNCLLVMAMLLHLEK